MVQFFLVVSFLVLRFLEKAFFLSKRPLPPKNQFLSLSLSLSLGTESELKKMMTIRHQKNKTEDKNCSNLLWPLLPPLSRRSVRRIVCVAERQAVYSQPYKTSTPGKGAQPEKKMMTIRHQKQTQGK
jgi:hypothetical protein